MTFGIEAQLNRLISRLPAPDQGRLLPQLETVELTAGQVLHASGRIPIYGYFPTTAVVSLVYMTRDGHCDEVAAVGAEGLVGVSSFLGGRSTPTAAIVQRAGRALRLPATPLRREVEGSPALRQVMLEYSCSLTVQVAQTAVCNCHHSLEQRLARRLLQGLDRQRGSDLVITQEQLARLLGVRRESITSEAMKLQSAALITYSRGHIRVIDRQGLEQRACECYAVVRREFDCVPSDTALWPMVLRSGDSPVAIAQAAMTGSEDLAIYLQQMREQERADLARELHDELGSLLTGAKLEVESLKKMQVGAASSDIFQRLQHLSETINSGILFSRRVVKGLRPPSLANLGLTASLELLAREFQLNTGIAMETDLEEVDLDEAAQFTVYRLVQESLNNTSNYAGATGARIVMLRCGSHTVMSVRDNGKGFDTATKRAASHGLAGMHHRVHACGGQLTVSSAPGLGTLVTAVLHARVDAGAFPAGAPPNSLATRSIKQAESPRPQRLSRCKRRSGRAAPSNFAAT